MAALHRPSPHQKILTRCIVQQGYNRERESACGVCLKRERSSGGGLFYFFWWVVATTNTPETNDQELYYDSYYVFMTVVVLLYPKWDQFQSSVHFPARSGRRFFHVAWTPIGIILGVPRSVSSPDYSNPTYFYFHQSTTPHSLLCFEHPTLLLTAHSYYFNSCWSKSVLEVDDAPHHLQRQCALRLLVQRRRRKRDPSSGSW